MDQFPSPSHLHRVLSLLLISTVLLPVGIVTLFVFARFFAISGDPVSAAILDGTAIGFTVLWLIGLVALLIGVVLATLQRRDS